MHFTADMWYMENGKKKLKPDAVPSVFNVTQDNIECSKCKLSNISKNGT